MVKYLTKFFMQQVYVSEVISQMPSWHTIINGGFCVSTPPQAAKLKWQLSRSCACECSYWNEAEAGMKPQLQCWAGGGSGSCRSCWVRCSPGWGACLSTTGQVSLCRILTRLAGYIAGYCLPSNKFTVNFFDGSCLTTVTPIYLGKDLFKLTASILGIAKSFEFLLYCSSVIYKSSWHYQ